MRDKQELNVGDLVKVRDYSWSFIVQNGEKTNFGSHRDGARQTFKVLVTDCRILSGYTLKEPYYAGTLAIGQETNEVIAIFSWGLTLVKPPKPQPKPGEWRVREWDHTGSREWVIANGVYTQDTTKFIRPDGECVGYGSVKPTFTSQLLAQDALDEYNRIQDTRYYAGTIDITDEISEQSKRAMWEAVGKAESNFVVKPAPHLDGWWFISNNEWLLWDNCEVNKQGCTGFYANDESHEAAPGWFSSREAAQTVLDRYNAIREGRD